MPTIETLIRIQENDIETQRARLKTCAGARNPAVFLSTIALAEKSLAILHKAQRDNARFAL